MSGSVGNQYPGGVASWAKHNSNSGIEYVDIKNKFYKFDGAKKYHETEDFTGTRLSLVFFFTNLTSSIPPKDRIMYFDKEIEYDIMNCKKNGKDSNNHT